MSPLRLARPVPHGGSGQEESRDRLRKCTEEQRPSRTSCPRRPSAGRLAFDGAAHVHLRELRLRKTEPVLFTPARDSRVPARQPLRLSRLLGRNTETRVGVLFAARAEATAGWLSVCSPHERELTSKLRRGGQLVCPPRSPRCRCGRPHACTPAGTEEVGQRSRGRLKQVRGVQKARSRADGVFGRFGSVLHFPPVLAHCPGPCSCPLGPRLHYRPRTRVPASGEATPDVESRPRSRVAPSWAPTAGR